MSRNNQLDCGNYVPVSRPSLLPGGATFGHVRQGGLGIQHHCKGYCQLCPCSDWGASE